MESTAKNDTRTTPMLSEAVRPLLLKFSIPILIGLVFTVSFQLADTLFIGQLGSAELAAIGFVFPVVLTLTHIGTGMDVGTMASVSPLIGRGANTEARKLVVDTLVLAILFSIFLTFVGLATMKPLFETLGVTADLLPMVEDYMVIWYWGLIVNFVPIVLAGTLRASGNAKDPGMWLTACALLNIALDPLFIFGLGPIEGMGIRGAAIATVIARTLYMLALFVIVARKAQLLDLSNYRVAGLLSSWKLNLSVTIPATVNNVIVPLTAVITTRILAHHGEDVIAGMGAATRVEAISTVFSLCVGISLAPFIGQNLGAGNMARIREGLRFSYRYATGVGLVFFVLLVGGRNIIASWFSEDPAITSVLSMYLLISGFSYIFQGLNIMATMALNALGRASLATLLTALRVLVFYAPLAYLLDGTSLGIPGVFGALTVAHALFAMIATTVAAQVVKRRESEVLSQQSTALA